jgi:hypothetical protein
MGAKLLTDRQRVWLSVANAVVLFLNLIVFVAKPNYLIRFLASMPAGLATLIVGAVGFIGVIWQTNRSIRNLIRSQGHRAKIEARARHHQFELNQKEKMAARGRAANFGGVIACGIDSDDFHCASSSIGLRDAGVGNKDAD